MNAPVSLQQRVGDYIAERRRLGFQIRARDSLLAGFARYVAERGHTGPLTEDIMVDWARQDQWHRGTPGSWAGRLAKVRHFARYLKQFEPETEVPVEQPFGPVSGRLAPHIFQEAEITSLLAAACGLGPKGSIRPASYEALFGLMASAGLRVSEAIHLRDGDVDLKYGMEDHPADQVCQVAPTSPPSERRRRAGVLPGRAGQACGGGFRPALPDRQPWPKARPAYRQRQAHRVFNALRDSLGWPNRGGHAAPRLHDLRHTFAVRRLVLWHAEGTDVDPMMLALSTYMGHAKIRHTYWYLSAAPELMALAAGKFESFAGLGGGEDE